MTTRPQDAGEAGLLFSEHIARLGEQFPEARGGFRRLMTQIMVAGKVISAKVRRAGLVQEMGATGRVNVQGEEVQFLDEFANETLIRMLGHTGNVCVMSSEENENPIPVPSEYPQGRYAVTFDPLDGSTNIDVNVSTGTIFSVHERTSESGPGTEADLMQPGHRQVAAGYIIYGSSTMLVYTARDCGVFGFTLDPSVGEFLLSHPNIRIPESAAVYSVNEGNLSTMSDRDRRLVHAFRDSENPSGSALTARYVGSLVADFHRNLIRGGVFLYPGTEAKPDGKLRLLSEAAPLSFLVEQAGGKATTGAIRVSDVVPTHLHQRVPLFIGSYRDVEFIESAYQE